MALFKEDWEKLAATPGLAKEAERLNRPNFWRMLEANDEYLWGECKSRGARYFRCILQPSQRRFYCNCSSQQVPCQHALSLLLFTITQSDIYRITHDLPEWVESGRTKLRAPGLKPKPLIDPALAEARKKRVLDDRVSLMQSGAKELLIWLKDNLRNGMAAAATQPDSYWEQFAALMVDAKLGAIGRRIRQIPILLQSDDWAPDLLDLFGQLYLFAKGMESYQAQEDHWQEELLVQGGLTTKKKDLEHLPGVVDYWLVLAMEEGQEERLDFRRTYLYGAASHNLGMLLDFSWNNQGYDHYWKVGQGMQAEAIDYPGANPIRWHLKNIRQGVQPIEIKGIPNINDLLNHYAQIFQLNPFATDLPIILESVRPIHRQNNDWVLIDEQEVAIHLEAADPQSLWKVLAVSGGQPISLFGTWNGKRFLVKTILDGQVIPL